MQIYINQIKNRIIFKIETGYKLELLSPDTMTLLGSTKKYVDQDKDGEDVLKLESIEVVLEHCNLVNNNYQQVSEVLRITFVPNKQFEQLNTIAPHSLTMLHTIITEFSYVDVWATDQNSKQIEIEDNSNKTLIIE